MKWLAMTQADSLGGVYRRVPPRVKLSPKRACLNTARFETCGGSVCMQRTRSIPPEKAESLVGWWAIQSENHPVRFVQMFKEDAARHFLEHYSILDCKQCLNEKPVWTNEQPRWTIKDVPKRHRNNMLGVPQRGNTSGLCWYSAMCFCLFFSRQMREKVYEKLPTEMKPYCRTVLSDPNDSETFRRLLYTGYDIGDDPDQDPKLDGQNGFIQLAVLLTRLDIPLIRLLAPQHSQTDRALKENLLPVEWRNRLYIPRKPLHGEFAVLFVQAPPGGWQPPHRLTQEGQEYRLFCALGASDECWHQVALALRSGRGGSCIHMAHSDSDAAVHGIGPIFWSIPAKKLGETQAEYEARSYKMWNDMLLVTKFRNDHCQITPSGKACPWSWGYRSDGLS